LHDNEYHDPKQSRDFETFEAQNVGKANEMSFNVEAANSMKHKFQLGSSNPESDD
jgi:hypothetical protein